jgi:Short C-terminal domain
VPTLLVIGTLVAFLAIFSVWVNRQALNTDNWVNTSTKLLENKEIQSQMSTFLVNQLYTNIDVEAELEKRLPPQAKALAGPAAGALRQLAQKVSERALASPPIQAIWAEANRAAHQALLKVIDGGGPAVSTEEGKVTLHLGALVSQVGSQIGLPQDLLSKLPPEAGNFTVLKSKQLSSAQKIAKLIRRLPVVLDVLLILLYAAAIYLARNRRREALRSVGFSVLIAGVLALLARNIAGNAVVDALASTSAVKPAAEAAWSIGTSLLVTVAASLIALGILVVIGAWLAGPTALATSLRRQASPYVRENRGAAYAVAGAIWLALIAWAPILAFRKPLGILIFAALFAAGSELLRRQTLAEFPDTKTGELSGHLRSLASSIGGGRVAREAGPAQDDQLARLERLSALHREGELTDAEFEAQKQKIL